MELDISRLSKKLLVANQNLDSIETIVAVSKQLENESNIMKSEIKLDSERGVDTSRKESALEDINERLDNISNQIKESVDDENNYIVPKIDSNRVNISSKNENNENTLEI